MGTYLDVITTNNNVEPWHLDSIRERFVGQLGLLGYNDALVIEDEIRRNGCRDAAQSLTSMVSDIISLSQGLELPLKVSTPCNRNGWKSSLDIEIGSSDTSLPIKSTSQFPIKIDLITDGKIEKAVHIDALSIPGVVLTNNIYELVLYSSKNIYSRFVFRGVTKRGVTILIPMHEPNSPRILTSNYMDGRCLLYVAHNLLRQIGALAA